MRTLEEAKFAAPDSVLLQPRRTNANGLTGRDGRRMCDTRPMSWDYVRRSSTMVLLARVYPAAGQSAGR